MRLLTKELAAKMPGVGSQDGNSGPGGKAPAIIKFFCPFSQWTWYATEANAILDEGDANTAAKEMPLGEAVKQGLSYVDVLFFGLVRGDALEFGYFGLNELQEEANRGMVERDLYWRPRPIGEIHREIEEFEE